MLWLLDGLFQFKSFMYTHAIVTEAFAPAAEKQWSIVGGGPLFVLLAFALFPVAQRAGATRRSPAEETAQVEATGVA